MSPLSPLPTHVCPGTPSPECSPLFPELCRRVQQTTTTFNSTQMQPSVPSQPFHDSVPSNTAFLPSRRTSYCNSPVKAGTEGSGQDQTVFDRIQFGWRAVHVFSIQIKLLEFIKSFDEHIIVEESVQTIFFSIVGLDKDVVEINDFDLPDFDENVLINVDFVDDDDEDDINVLDFNEENLNFEDFEDDSDLRGLKSNNGMASAMAISQSVLSITIDECPHRNEKKSIIAPFSNSTTFIDIFNQYHDFGLKNNEFTVTGKNHEISPTLTVGEVVQLFNLNLPIKLLGGVVTMKYVDRRKDNHEIFEMKDSGLVLNSSFFKFPYLGASPDGIANCDYCGDICIEIKCPYRKRDVKLDAALDKRDCLEMRDAAEEDIALTTTIQKQTFSMTFFTALILAIKNPGLLHQNHVKEHKTGDISPANIGIDCQLYVFIVKYINLCKFVPNYMEDEDESIFITWPRHNEVPGRLEKLRGMQHLWEKENPKKLTATKLRKSVSTSIRESHPELREKLADHMNHLATTADKYYVMKSTRDKALEMSNVIHQQMTGQVEKTMVKETYRYQINLEMYGWRMKFEKAKVTKNFTHKTCNKTNIEVSSIKEKVSYLETKIIFKDELEELPHSNIVTTCHEGKYTDDVREVTVRTPSKKVTVQDIHDMQYRALQGKIEIQEKQKIQMDLEKNKLELQIELLQKLVGGSSEPVTLSQALASMYKGKLTKVRTVSLFITALPLNLHVDLFGYTVG
ncbi:unnamed protein product [Mytilus edulis]|uniref:YqaJ viral recombinase domain-containing protein n=1 Tax=Mytilus edulis TaxID=6550 RepID=A0A8S3TBS4_MYTED|nr:unnamed protein product [Mytilus edulis]